VLILDTTIFVAVEELRRIDYVTQHASSLPLIGAR